MLTISKVPLRKAIHAQFWPGYKLPLFFAVVSLIGILVILAATLTALLISNRRLKQKHLKKISIGDDHLLHINKNILLISPPESDPESDILFDKNRDVIQPKFRRFTAGLLSKITQPFIKEHKEATEAAQIYDSEFVRYPFSQATRKYRSKINHPISNEERPMGLNLQVEGASKDNPTKKAEISENKNLRIHRREKTHLQEVRKGSLDESLEEDCKITFNSIKIPKSAVGRLYVSLRLRRSESPAESISLNIYIKKIDHLPLNQSPGSYFMHPNKYYVAATIKAIGPKPISSVLSPHAFNSESKFQYFRFFLHSFYDEFSSARTDIAEGFHRVHFRQTLILQMPKLTKGLEEIDDETYSRRLSTSEIADIQRQYELHLTLFHCEHSYWYRRDNALGSSSITLSGQLLQRLSSNKKEEMILDLYPIDKELK
ncbi:hypothetical protein ACTXT7_004237 [Hymenolepis weldensis]